MTMIDSSKIDSSKIDSSKIDDNNNTAQIRVGVLFGGRSSEHEVSLASARNVMDALGKAGYAVTPIGISPQGKWLTTGDPMRMLAAQAAGDLTDSSSGVHDDAPQANGGGAWALLPSASRAAPLPPVDVIFPVLHGPFGEDGTVQGLLEMANIPYVGCGVLASAVCMDKELARRLFAAEGLPQPEYTLVLRNNWIANRSHVLDTIEGRLNYPLFIKPANLGSSVGISKAADRTALAAALDLAALYDRKLIVEAAVPHAREIEVSVLGNDEVIASVPGEIIPGAEFYDYAAKYLDDTSELCIPAPLDAATTEQVRAMAVRAFKAVDGTGLARVDFLLNGATGELYLNEINTMPGFTRISMFPKLWEASGTPYAELVDMLVTLGLERYADRQQNHTTRD
jgi:D-alanine-D-alanine ligase